MIGILTAVTSCWFRCSRQPRQNMSAVANSLKTAAIASSALLLPGSLLMSKFVRNYTGDDRDGSDHAGQKERRNEGVLQHTLTEERIGSWSDQKLEKMIKRNSVVKDNENHVREVHTLSRKKSSNSMPAPQVE